MPASIELVTHLLTYLYLTGVNRFRPYETELHLKIRRI